MDIFDIIIIAENLLASIEGNLVNNNQLCSDFNNDEMVNIFDIIIMVDSILYD